MGKKNPNPNDVIWSLNRSNQSGESIDFNYVYSLLLIIVVSDYLMGCSVAVEEKSS